MWPFYWILTLRLPREQVQTTNRKTYIQFHQKTFHLLFLIQVFIIIIIHLTVLHCGALSTLVCQPEQQQQQTAALWSEQTAALLHEKIREEQITTHFRRG